MAMEWTEETIARLRELWQQGLSTAEIGRQLAVTKNAVVGKAHRLGLQSRPSPIRRPPAARATEAGDAKVASVVATVPVMPVPVAPTLTTVVSNDGPATPVAGGVPVASVPPVGTVAAVTPRAETAPGVTALRPAPSPVAPVPQQEPASERVVTAEARAADPVAPAPVTTRPPLRAVTPPAPRRSGLTCCWPLGDPGTPGFHFCGATPVPGKPYCAEHAQVAYVKLRDRRDNVA